MKRKNINCLALFFLTNLVFCSCDEEVLLNPSYHETTNEQSLSARKNPAPSSHAGVDKVIVLPVDSVMLDGSLSTGSIQQYGWEKFSGPESYFISDPSARTTSVTGLIEGAYIFALTVIDGRSRASVDFVSVTVRSEETPPTTDSIYFQGNMDNVSIITVNSKLVFNGWDQL